MKNTRGWIIVLAGMGINLAFGVLYSWSIFAKTLTDLEGWTKTQSSIPYTTAIFFFALTMIPAGKLQDKYGGRLIASVGGILTGLGLILASFFTSVLGLCFAFGILAGSGIGIGYAAATPSAVKWFPESKKGIITGIVVSGFGLSTLYMAPLTNFLIIKYGIFSSFRMLGVSFLIIVTGLAQFFKEPESSSIEKEIIKEPFTNDFNWREMLKTKQFIQLWIMLASGALGGLMIIGHLSKIAFIQLDRDIGFILVALTAIFNAAGRPISGIISDKIGRVKTMMILSISQGIIFLLLGSFNTFFTLLFGAAVITFTYGGNFAVYPSAISDLFGKKNFGVNYGVLFSAWGIGGVAGPLIAGKIADAAGSYTPAYIIASILCFISAAIAIGFKRINTEPTKIQSV